MGAAQGQNAFTEKQQAFLDFVLGHYVGEGIQKLDGPMLSQLVTLRYRSASDVVVDLEPDSEIRELLNRFPELSVSAGGLRPEHHRGAA